MYAWMVVTIYFYFISRLRNEWIICYFLSLFIRHARIELWIFSRQYSSHGILVYLFCNQSILLTRESVMQSAFVNDNRIDHLSDRLLFAMNNGYEIIHMWILFSANESYRIMGHSKKISWVQRFRTINSLIFLAQKKCAHRRKTERE